MANELTKIIQESILKSRKPARDVAEEVGKPYPTLMREINPEDSGAKVGVESLPIIMNATGNIQPLTYLSNLMGYLLVPLQVDTKDPDEATLLALDLMDGFGCYAKTLKQALQGKELDREEALEVEKAGYEAMTSIMTMLSYLKKKMEEQENAADDSKKPHLAIAG